MDLVSALKSLDRFFWDYRRGTVTKNCRSLPIFVSVLIKSIVSDLVITLNSGHLISSVRDNHKRPYTRIMILLVYSVNRLTDFVEIQ